MILSWKPADLSAIRRSMSNTPLLSLLAAAYTFFSSASFAQDPYCAERLKASPPVQASCQYEDGPHKVCLNFIGAGIPKGIIDLSCMAAPAGIEKTPCPTLGMARLCAKHAGAPYHIEAIAYRPLPPQEMEPCESTPDTPAIFCDYP
jgi:hypothetical protein